MSPERRTSRRGCAPRSRPVDPPERAAGAHGATLDSLVELAADELEAWELGAMRDPRNWPRAALGPAAAIVVGTGAAAGLVVLRTQRRRHKRRAQSHARAISRPHAARRRARGAARCSTNWRPIADPDGAPRRAQHSAMDVRALADEDLVPLMARGDARAFETIYERHAGAAYSLAYRMVGTRASAEDVTQEAFLNLWRSGAHYDRARGSVRTWILGIVHHRAIDALRRASVHSTPALRRRDRGRAPGGARAGRGGRRPARRGGDRARRDGRAAGRAGQGDRARLLRRLHPRGDRRDARRSRSVR